MKDLIERQAAIDAVSRGCHEFRGIFARCEKNLNELPSAQRGRWISHEDEDGGHYGDKCSECGEWYVMPYGKTNFCPNCGADMRGEQNE